MRKTIHGASIWVAAWVAAAAAIAASSASSSAWRALAATAATAGKTPNTCRRPANTPRRPGANRKKTTEPGRQRAKHCAVDMDPQLDRAVFKITAYAAAFATLRAQQDRRPR